MHGIKYLILVSSKSWKQSYSQKSEAKLEPSVRTSSLILFVAQISGRFLNRNISDNFAIIRLFQAMNSRIAPWIHVRLSNFIPPKS